MWSSVDGVSAQSGRDQQTEGVERKEWDVPQRLSVFRSCLRNNIKGLFDLKVGRQKAPPWKVDLEPRDPGI